MERIEFWHNKASDIKFVWFPFYFLRPAPEVEIRWPLKFKMIVCFGLYYGTVAALRSCIFSGGNIIQELMSDIPLAILVFTIWFNCITAPIWNVRANRLTEKLNY